MIRATNGGKVEGSAAKKLVRAGTLAAAVALILLVNVIRFIGLEQSPPGFHVDELSGAVTVQCLEQEGVDALGQPYPLFAHLKYGSPKPPTYLYPAIAWTRLFGHSIGSYRALSALFALLGVAAVFVLAARMWGWETAVWCALVGSLSPTLFQVSRVALEPGLAPLFIIAAMACYWDRTRLWGAVAAGALFAAAMYSYPPARLFVPLFVIVFAGVRWCQGQRRWMSLVVLAVTLCLVNIPLVRGTLSGEYMGRFDKIGILSPAYLAEQGKERRVSDVAGIFLRNYATHLSVDYLFVSGDENLVYSTGRFGLLGWMEAAALLCAVLMFMAAVVRTARARAAVDCQAVGTVLLLIAGIGLAIVPAALTWQDIPHSLRMILYWPFLALLGGWAAAAVCRWVPYAGPGLIVIAGVFTVVYLQHYFTIYPQSAYYMFSGFTKDEALAAKTQKDWLKFIYRYRRQDYHTRYYLMNYLEGQTCSSSQKVWKEVHKIP